MRFLEAPGPAVLRQSVAALRREINPQPIQLQRFAANTRDPVLALYNLRSFERGLAACRFLAQQGLSLTAVRGRLIPEHALTWFDRISFEDGLDALLNPAPKRWELPLVVVETFHPDQAFGRYVAQFTQIPDPGLLDFADIGEASREGAPKVSLGLDATERAEKIISSMAAVGCNSCMGIDIGGDVSTLACVLADRDMLGAWFGPARRPIPERVLSREIPVYTWFEPEDTTEQALRQRKRVKHGCAYVPVGLLDEGVPEATARILSLRELGYRAIVPRFHIPQPNTHEWSKLPARTPLPALDGTLLPFELPAYPSIRGPELLGLWMRDNVWPTSRTSTRPRQTSSFRDVRRTLDSYLAGTQARVSVCHGRDMLVELLDALPSKASSLDEIDDYPFLAYRGVNLLDLVESAIERRLRSVTHAPEPLHQAMLHAAVARGKRIRPILTLAIACSQGVAVEDALHPALATEWIHTASLLQDDMPCMDNDSIRRQDVSSHIRYGEGMALLASDAFIAMAFADVAELAGRATVGPARCARLIKALADTLGLQGLVGGQARDLLTRSDQGAGIDDVIEVHRRKTAPLFEVTARLGCTLAGLPEDVEERFAQMLNSMGLAFQIVDDVLDMTKQNPAFGRPAGSDARNGLPTFGTLLGQHEARRYAKQLLGPVADSPQLGLQRLAQFVLDRQQ